MLCAQAVLGFGVMGSGCGARGGAPGILMLVGEMVCCNSWLSAKPSAEPF